MPLDIACVIVLAMFSLIGFLKGFLSQLISIVALIAGLLATMALSGTAAEWVVAWLMPRAPSLQPAYIRIGVFVILLFTLYILVAAALEAAKKKLLHSFTLQLNDRLWGLLVGLVKGVALVLVLVLVCDRTQAVAERVASPRGYEWYTSTMDASDVFSGSRYLLGFSRDWSPTVSTMLHRVELLPPFAAQTNASPAAAHTNMPPAAPQPAPGRTLVPAPLLTPAPTTTAPQETP